MVLLREVYTAGEEDYLFPLCDVSSRGRRVSRALLLAQPSVSYSVLLYPVPAALVLYPYCFVTELELYLCCSVTVHILYILGTCTCIVYWYFHWTVLRKILWYQDAMQ